MHFFALEALRGLLAIIVVLSHIHGGPLVDNSFLAMYEHAWWMQWYYRLWNGIGAVDVFFALTGFLMCFVYPHVYSFRNFLSHRVIRLYPLYVSFVLGYGITKMYDIQHLWYKLGIIILVSVFTWLVGWYARHRQYAYFWFYWYIVAVFITGVGTVMRWVMPVQWVTLQTNAWYELIVQMSLFQWIAGKDQYIIVIWSLQTEMFFYILYGLFLWRIFQKIRWHRAIDVFLFWIVAHIFIAILGIYIRDLNFYRWGAFIAGITWAHMLRNIHDIRRKIMRPVGLIYFTGALLLYMTQQQVNPFNDMIWGRTRWIILMYHFSVTVLYDFVLFYMLALITCISSKARSWWAMRILMGVGTISYSIYLIHLVILDHIYTQSPFVFFVVLFIRLFLVSIILFLLHERPYRVWKKLLARHIQKVHNPVIVLQKPWDYRGGLLICMGAIGVGFVFLYADYFSRVNWRIHMTVPKVIQVAYVRQKTHLLRNGDMTRIIFVAPYDNMGSIFLPLTTTHNGDGVATGKLILQLRDAAGNILSSNEQGIQAYKQYNERGIALQTASAGKKYMLDLKLMGVDNATTVQWNRPPNKLLTGHIIQPKKLVQLRDIVRLHTYAIDSYHYYIAMGGGILIPLVFVSIALMCAFFLQK